MPPLRIARTFTASTGKHYRYAAEGLPCYGTATCSMEGLHVHVRTWLLDPLPVTYRGMVTWPTRHRRCRRAR